MLMREDINWELIKNIMIENKIILPSLINQEKSWGRNGKGKQIIINYPTCNMTELKELIYAGTRPVCQSAGAVEYTDCTSAEG